MREKLPNRRRCITHSVKVNGQSVHFSVGLYDDGRPGELFIDMHRTGTAVRAWCESTAKLISLMLQYKVPLHELVDVLVEHCTEPFGRVPVTGHPSIHDTSGVLDVIVRSLALDFLAGSAAVEPSHPLEAALRNVEHMDAAELYELLDEDVLDSFLEKFRDNADS